MTQPLTVFVYKRSKQQEFRVNYSRCFVVVEMTDQMDQINQLKKSRLTSSAASANMKNVARFVSNFCMSDDLNW